MAVHYIRKLTYLFFLLWPLMVIAQHPTALPPMPPMKDSLIPAQTSNLFYVDVLGPNYLDVNSDNKCLVSVNYARKYISNKKHCSLLLNIGISAFKARYYTFNSNQRQTVYNYVLTTPIGILCRKRYKRNGFWAGVYCVPAFGKQWYEYNKGQTSVGFVRNFNYQLSPVLVYQFQTKDENLFFQIRVTPIIYPQVTLSASFEDGNVPFFPFWAGIALGGAF